MKIFIIRHGETTSDVENKYGGDYDDHLTEKGITQAKELAEKIANCGIEIIFSSPRIRAKETADILNEVLKCEVQVIYDLRERNAYGVLTGMNKEEAKIKYPEYVDLLGDHRSTIADAETYEHLLGRVDATFKNIANSSYEIVAIVSHGGFIRCLFRDVLKFGKLKEISDCAFVELEKDDLELKIINMNGMSIEK